MTFSNSLFWRVDISRSHSHPFPTGRAAFWAGVRAELPILLGVLPFGLIYGVSALAAGFSPLLAQAMSSIVFAGSAQFILVQLVAANVPAALMVITAFVVNLRHVLYSASIAPHLQSLSGRARALLAYLLTDEAYAVAIIHYQEHPQAPGKGWYLAGAGLALWTTWQLSTAAGLLLGAAIPGHWPLDFAVPLTFIALAVPAIRDRPALAAALVSGVVVLLTAGLPHKLNLLVATFAGIVAGLLLESRQRPEDRP